MRISDWSSDVCSSDLGEPRFARKLHPGRGALARQPVKVVPIADSVHRVPETVVLVGEKFAVPRKVDQRGMLKRFGIARQIIQHARLEHEEAAVDPGFLLLHLFGELDDLDRKSVVSGKSVYVGVNPG